MRPHRTVLILAFLTSPACLPVSFDLDRPIAIVSPGRRSPYSFLERLREGLELLGNTPGGGQTDQTIEVRFEADLRVGGSRVEAGVDTRDNGTIVLSASGAALPEDKLRALALHELGHVLGAGHVPSCEGVNYMAVNCVPYSPGYSAADIDLICRRTTGGVCGRPR